MDGGAADRPHPNPLPRGRGRVGPTAWGALFILAAVRLALYAYSQTTVAYGYIADELYFLDCAARLDWGYVDHPPFSVALLRAITATAGDSVPALRTLPALCGAAAIVLTGLIARELGGGRAAQVLAALAELAAPTVLWLGTYYSMNAVEVALLAAATYVLVRLLNGAAARTWLVLGLLLGLALLNKASALWFGVGIAVGLLATAERRWLATPWPWLAAVLALALFVPHLAWQARHDWPTLEFMRNGLRDVMVSKPPLEFARDQVRAMHPVGTVLALAGIAWLAVAAPARPYRPLAWLFAAVIAVLVASGSARPYYLTPFYPLAFAAGGVAVDRLAARRGWRWLPYAVGALLAIGGAVAAPLAVPLLPPERLVAYQTALGFEPPRTEFESDLLPVHFALAFGWPEVARAAADAYARLPAAERTRAGVLATTFGEAGALSVHGRHHGLPVPLGTHNTYWLWSRERLDAAPLIIVAAPDAPILQHFADVTPVGRVECTYCLPLLRRRQVFIARAPRRPLREIWPQVKDFS